MSVQRQSSRLLTPRNSADLVGQDEILRPIGNRPCRKLHFTPRRPINNRPQDSILPHNGSCSFRIDSELPALPQGGQSLFSMPQATGLRHFGDKRVY
jgi:hypothetical protein